MILSTIRSVDSSINYLSHHIERAQLSKDVWPKIRLWGTLVVIQFAYLCIVAPLWNYLIWEG